MARHSLLKLSTYTQHTTSILFIFGFLVDIRLLPDISEHITQYIGLAYLLGIGLCIIIREWVVARNTASSLEQKVYATLTFSIAYLSGSALSFVFVYVIRGADFSVSWPLYVLLLTCILANEVISSHKYRFSLDVGVLFIAMLFYIVFTIPIIVGSQNDFIFLVSMIATVLVGLVYIFILQGISEMASYEAPRGYALALGIPMFVGMLYVLNIIPAVPLSLASHGVYHTLTKYDDGSYLGAEEVYSSTIGYFRTPVYHLMLSDDGVYVFASVKAPAKVTAPIAHVWEYYDESTHRWNEMAVIAYTTEGGRDAGYRAYSHKSNVAEGLWRVTVRVGDNRIVGRIKFRVQKTDQPVAVSRVVF
jgi:hypothetical protein